MYSFPLILVGNNDLEDEVEYLHSTDEREASEEPHGSSYGGQFVYKLGCSVLQSEESQENI